VTEVRGKKRLKLDGLGKALAECPEASDDIFVIERRPVLGRVDDPVIKEGTIALVPAAG
jgi:hypothetical protein